MDLKDFAGGPPREGECYRMRYIDVVPHPSKRQVGLLLAPWTAKDAGAPTAPSAAGDQMLLVILSGFEPPTGRAAFVRRARMDMEAEPHRPTPRRGHLGVDWLDPDGARSGAAKPHPLHVLLAGAPVVLSHAASATVMAMAMGAGPYRGAKKRPLTIAVAAGAVWCECAPSGWVARWRA
jgi:hypothetical protein